MAVLTIRIFGDPVLRTRAEEVTQFDSALDTLVEDMFDTMEAGNGVGLAANQIGVLKRVFVFDTTHHAGGMRGHIINPVWTPLDDEIQIDQEGCLSIPDIMKDTQRYNNIAVTGVDKDKRPISMKVSGLLARCIQHETDHLDGVLFLQRLTPELRKEAMKEIRSSRWFNLP